MCGITALQSVNALLARLYRSNQSSEIIATEKRLERNTKMEEWVTDLFQNIYLHISFILKLEGCQIICSALCNTNQVIAMAAMSS